MRAVGITAPGGYETLTIIDRDVRAAGPGEVRISVRAAAVNPTDVLFRGVGTDEAPPPWTPGMDAAGTIESRGDGVDRLRVGQQVMAAVNPRRAEGGAQAELIVVPAASVVAIPDGATLEQAATLPMNGLTATYGLEVLGLAAGETLAVTGAAGQLASLLIPLAKERGLRVIADAKPQDEALVRSFGADVVVARGEGYPAAVRATAPAGADGLYDAGLMAAGALGAIRDGGAMIVARLERPESERGIRIESIRVANVFDRTDWLEHLRALASAGELALRVAETFPPERIADAQRLMAAGGLRGRAVIVF